MLAVVSSVFDEGAKPGCLVGRAFHHHQRAPPQPLPQKFMCPLKLLGLSCFRLSVKVRFVNESLSNIEMNVSGVSFPYLNHLSSLLLPGKIQSPLNPEN